MSDFQNFIAAFKNGRAFRAQNFLGSRLNPRGCLFRVWAPNALGVSVAGDFNSWNENTHSMKIVGGGIWETEIGGITENSAYKYVIRTADGQILWKADPYGFRFELRPASATLVCSLIDYLWHDEKWLDYRRSHKVYNSPMNIYEVNLGSWKRGLNGEYMTFRQAADDLIPYVLSMGFTHIEFMPLTEYPYDASWGYQCTGYFAATSRYGTPHDLMYLIDKCHEAGLGVIMDWVPAHFPKDSHGLVEYDGSRLYECSDTLMAEHPSWGTRIFDYSKGEVKSFLISSALFWLETYHCDGIRVDAVASMLYLDYERKGSEWHPNKHGGRENFDAVDFLRALNTACFEYDDSIIMVAEESTTWPLVTAPVEAGGLGFNLKWNMGWMNDSLHYIKTDPVFRSHVHNKLTFSLTYAFSENFILPISHDEVVHMKGSLLNKTPGTLEQKLANVRCFLAYMLAHPGKKLLFMGAELGQESEWDFGGQLPWKTLQHGDKAALNTFLAEANNFYKACVPLWEIDFKQIGFEWICPDERDRNIFAFIRKDKSENELLFICNFSGHCQRAFRFGVPIPGAYGVLLSTDEAYFGGSGKIVSGNIFDTDNIPQHGRASSLSIDIPPLTAIFLVIT